MNPAVGSLRFRRFRGALMPTREAALTELAAVFQMISDEYTQRNQMLPADTNEILHAWRLSSLDVSILPTTHSRNPTGHIHA